MKNIFVIILSISIILSLIVYMEISKGKAIWYQTISDRYYYFNYILSDGEEKVLEHLSRLVIDDIYAIGEKKININNFSDTFQSTFLCVGHSKSSEEQLIVIFRKDSYSSEGYSETIFINGIRLIAKHCKKMNT